jgi:glycyl-tRNA synthetase beta subunit
MRWGHGTLRWVRPLQRILCVFDGKVGPIAKALADVYFDALDNV